ncbi:hypothetical protein D3C75_1155850 [compost metagenome]
MSQLVMVNSAPSMERLSSNVSLDDIFDNLFIILSKNSSEWDVRVALKVSCAKFSDISS